MDFRDAQREGRSYFGAEQSRPCVRRPAGPASSGSFLSRALGVPACFALAMPCWVAILLLVACGGGGGSDSGFPPSDRQALATLTELYETVSVSMRTGAENPTAAEVLSYLAAHASGGPRHSGPTRTTETGLVRFAEPPTVRLAEGTTAEQRGLVLYSVAVVNRWLPYDQHVRIGSDAPALAAIEDIPDGQIFIDFVPHGGRSTTQFDDETRWEKRSTRAGHVWVGWDGLRWDPDRRFVVFHELLHALGLLGHIRGIAHIDSIMRAEDISTSWPQTYEIPAIDGEALRILYTQLGAATEPEELSLASLGQWDRQWTHLMGEFPATFAVIAGCALDAGPSPVCTTGTSDYLAFGVRHRNGVSVPWTDGDPTFITLADTRTLQGQVTWEGGLLGFTPDLRSVAGNASIGVNLDTMDGRADFTGLQFLPGEQAMRGFESVRWNTGRLGYTIEISGNYIRSTGGDDGTLSGIFFGPDHEGIAGSVERQDLTAAFGARREY